MFFKKKNELAVVKMNELAPTEEINELDLVEIRDEKVINRIVSAVPGAAQMVGNAAVATKTIGVAQAGVFQAILPSGAQLVNSQVTEGAVRGFFQQGGKIAGQAVVLCQEKVQVKNDFFPFCKSH